MSEAAAPAAPSKIPRIVSLDLLRGYAVLGMLLINIPEMGRSIHDLFSGPYEGWTETDKILFWVREIFVEGNNRTLFTMLFGAAFMIMVSKAMRPEDPVGPVDLYYRRCLWMLLFGIIHATLLLWPSDILFHYAAPAMALLPFRNWSPKALIFLVIPLICVLNLCEARTDIGHARLAAIAKAAEAKQDQGKILTGAEEAAIEEWQDVRDAPKIDQDELKKEQQARKGYWSSVVFQTKVWLSWLDIDAFCWGLEAFTFMLLGIAFFKLGILTGQRTTKFYLLLALFGLGLGTTINLHETWLKWSTFDAPDIWQDDITYQFSRTLNSIGLIGLLIICSRTIWGNIILTPVTYIGRMALTNYVLQSVIGAILFTGFGLFGKFSNIQLWLIAICIWVFQIIVSVIWFKYYRMGPLEWFWRVLIYWSPQPLRHPQQATTR